MFCFRNYHFIALAVLLFSVASWGACQSGNMNYNYPFTPSGYVSKSCFYSPSSCSGCTQNQSWATEYCQNGEQLLNGGAGSCPPTYQYNGWIYTGAIEICGHYQSTCNVNTSGCLYTTRCNNKCEADSVQFGGIILECQYDIVEDKWYKWTCHGGNSCQGGYCQQEFYDDASLCEEKYCEDNPSGCIDSTVCDEARQRCRKLGGVFEGHPLEDGCSSSCNTCGTNATKQILKIKTESCCSQGLAPEVDAMCRTDVQSGVGETYSTNANLKCADPNLSQEAAGWYAEYCSGEHDWGDEGSSSSGGEGESSSSGEDEYSSGEGFSSAEGLEGDYYPILDTIRDTLIDIRRNVENIYLCLVTPSACAGLSTGQDTVIVNVPSDSVKLKDISSKLTVLDTSIHNSNDRLLEGISHANDTLIDSMRKYLNSSGFSGDTLGDSLGKIHGTLEEIKGALDGEEVDTTGYGSWGDLVGEGTAIGDSIGVASGWVGGLDTVNIDSVFSAAVASDSLNADSIGEHVDSLLQARLDSLHNELKLSIDSSRTSLLDSMDVWADTIAALAPWADFDSLIYSTIGAKIPNSDNCPENCQQWSLNLPGFGLVNYTVDFGLCLGRSVLGNLSALGFIRLLIRLVVVWTCIWFVIWNFTKKKD